jgi:CheY-like chemotaxis protein
VADTGLHNRRILVVEDDYLLADDLRYALEKGGAIVLGPVPRVEMALKLINCGPTLDGALLDINLAGEMVFPVADALAARNVCFLFTTGYAASDVPPKYRHVARCEKPLDLRLVQRLLGEEYRQKGLRSAWPPT